MCRPSNMLISSVHSSTELSLFEIIFQTRYKRKTHLNECFKNELKKFKYILYILDKISFNLTGRALHNIDFVY